MQKQILVMEDNDVLRGLYSRALRATGQAVYQAATLAEARDLLRDHPFDLVLCDVEIGDERGLDLLQEERDRFRLYGTQVIVASAEERYRQQCEALGVEFFLEKPIEVTPLLDLVGRLMSN